MALTVPQLRQELRVLLDELGYLGNKNNIDDIIKWYYGETTTITRNGIAGQTLWQKIYDSFTAEGYNDQQILEYCLYKLLMRKDLINGTNEVEVYEEAGYIDSLK